MNLHSDEIQHIWTTGNQCELSTAWRLNNNSSDTFEWTVKLTNVLEWVNGNSVRQLGLFFFFPASNVWLKMCMVVWNKITAAGWTELGQMCACETYHCNLWFTVIIIWALYRSVGMMKRESQTKQVWRNSPKTSLHNNCFLLCTTCISEDTETIWTESRDKAQALGLLPGLRGDSYTDRSASCTPTKDKREQNKEHCSLKTDYGFC